MNTGHARCVPNGDDRYCPLLADARPSIVFVDSSNAFFNWYYGALATYNRKHKRPRGATVDESDCAGMAELMSIFQLKCISKITDIMTLTGASLQDILFALDCPRSEIWRHDIFLSTKGATPIYKASRPARTDAGIPVMRNILYDHILPHIIPNPGIGAARAEADDVIAVLTRLVTHRAPQRRIYVFSDDSDFVQLLDHPSVTIYTQRHQNMREKYTTDPRRFLRMKCLMGDRSDNIDGAFPRCGPKTALALVNDPMLLAKKKQRYGEDKLNRNRTLIDFDCIPMTIRSRIVERGVCTRHK